MVWRIEKYGFMYVCGEQKGLSYYVVGCLGYITYIFVVNLYFDIYVILHVKQNLR